MVPVVMGEAKEKRTLRCEAAGGGVAAAPSNRSSSEPTRTERRRGCGAAAPPQGGWFPHGEVGPGIAAAGGEGFRVEGSGGEVPTAADLGAVEVPPGGSGLGGTGLTVLHSLE